MNMEIEFFDRIQKGDTVVEGSPYPVTKRSWGCSVGLGENTVLNLLNDGEPSAHFHRIRTEEYILYSGKMAVYRAKNIEGDIEKTVAAMVPTILSPGDRVVIEPGIVHIPLNSGDAMAMFVEISHGAYLDDDIERIYDKSGRDASLVARWVALGYQPGISIRDLVRLVQQRINK